MVNGRICTYCKSDNLRVDVTGNGEITGHYKYQICCGSCEARGPAYNLPIYNKTAKQNAIEKILHVAGNEVYDAAEALERAEKNRDKYVTANNVYLDLVANLTGYVFGGE